MERELEERCKERINNFYACSMCVFIGVWLIPALTGLSADAYLHLSCSLFMCYVFFFTIMTSRLKFHIWLQKQELYFVQYWDSFCMHAWGFSLLSMSSRLWGESRYAWSGVYGDIYIPDGHRCRPEWYDGSTVSEDATLQTGGWDLQTDRPRWIDVWMKQQDDLVNA